MYFQRTALWRIRAGTGALFKSPCINSFTPETYRFKIKLHEALETHAVTNKVNAAYLAALEPAHPKAAVYTSTQL